MGVFKKQRPFGRPRGDRPQLHDAVCDQCGKNCRVPFMPSNGKPVYCSDCFETRGNGGDAPRRVERNGFGNRLEKRSYTPSFDRPERSERPQALHNEKLDIIIAKLDKVLKLLKLIMVESPEIVDEVSDIVAEVDSKNAKKSKSKKEVSEVEAFVTGNSELRTEEVTE